jgi:hypothetical protein
MRIIALRGGDSCGKSATLNLVHNHLTSATIGGISTCKVQIGNPIYKDFSDIVNYKGLQIAFYTMGDYANQSIKAIYDYNILGVDILILASNIKFRKPILLINTFTHNLVFKTIASPKNAANNLTANTVDANVIFGLI